MKRGNLNFGVLIIIASVAAISSIFLFTANNEASSMATWYQPEQDPNIILKCELGCYQTFESQIRANINPAPSALQHCITYCHNLPPY